MHCSAASSRLAVLLLVCGLLQGTLLNPTVWAQDDQPVATAMETDRLWADGVDQIVAGHFSEARNVLERIIENSPSSENYVVVASWLDRRAEWQSQRIELQRQQRQKYLDKAKEVMAEEQWADALGWSRAAMVSATEEPAFMKEEWFAELTSKAEQAAEQLVQDKKWQDASQIYFELSNLYEGNQHYEDRLNECLGHSRLDALYNEKSKWKDRLRGITERIVDDTLYRIHANYVIDASFKELAEAAIKRLLLIAESETMMEQFPAMNDEQLLTQYKMRLQRTLNKVKREPKIDYERMVDLAERAITINRQSIKLPKELIIYEFLEGALSKLDQFTSMIWPYDYAEFEKHTQGHFTGVGIQIGTENNQLTVVSPLEDTPAFRAGIQAGDTITHIDGEPTEGITLNEAVSKITGLANTKVVLTINRPRTQKSFDVELVRDIIQIQTVKGVDRSDGKNWNYMIDKEFGIGYIRLTNFATSTSEDLKRALHELQGQGARALILDLRFNPGGLLRSAIEIAELFLPPDKLIVRTEGLNSEPFSKSSSARAKHYDFPMIVLVNDQSASASEIVAGALKDHHRAMIIGERTFGKGSVQNLIPMGNNTDAHLKLTTAHYYLPDGQCIHRMPDSEVWGVDPDITVEMVPRERVKVLLMRRDADVIRTPGVAAQPAESDGTQGPVDQPATSSGSTGEGSAAEEADDTGEVDEEEEVLVELPDVDYQLETALLVLRTQLLKDVGFAILPKVQLGEAGNRSQEGVVTN